MNLTIKNAMIAFIIVVIVVLVPLFVIKYVISKENEFKDDYNKQRESYLNVIKLYEVKSDSLQKRVNFLEGLILDKDSVIYNINMQYDKKFNYVRNLSIDDHITFFSNYLSKEDSIRKGYSNSNTTGTDQGLQFFIR